MKLDDRQILEIHESGAHLVLAVTGGGTSAIAALLRVPGASRSVLEAIVPYHEKSLTGFLGQAPEQACSATTARMMAMTAFQRAGSIIDADPPTLLGVGCTAALATDRQRKGRDRCFIAIQSADATREIRLLLDKQTRSRAEEEDLCAATILNAIRAALALPEATHPPLGAGDDMESEVVIAKPEWQALLKGESKLCREGIQTEPAGAVFPGTFNPMHEGHRQMAAVASDMLGTDITLEISVFNVDKAPLDYLDMARRLDSIGGEFPMVFSHAPTFVEKARLFPGVTFLVGSDTMQRIIDPRYYNNSTAARDEALAEIVAHDNRFLVFGRLIGDSFIGLDDLALPAPVRNICTGVPEERFRRDVSSTGLRNEKSEVEIQYR